MIPLEDEGKPARKKVIWDANLETQLFHAMVDHKPVGPNKYFNMICIWSKLSDSVPHVVTTEDIWEHLETMYNLQLLEEVLPFPNPITDFSLPENEYFDLMKQKSKESAVSEDTAGDASPVIKVSSRNSSQSSKDGTPKGASTTKSRKESGSSHASTDTPSNRSEKDYSTRSEKRRDSRDSNASGPKDSSTTRKQRGSKQSRASTSTELESHAEEETGRRGRRRQNTSTPPAIPAKRRRT